MKKIIILSLFSTLLTYPAWSQFSVTLDETHVCGGSLGSIDTTVPSGTYTYAWTGPGTFTSTSQNISNLQAGLYTVTVTKTSTPGSGGVVIKSATLEESTNPLGLTFNPVNTNNVICNGETTGKISVTVSNGTGPYLYAIKFSSDPMDFTGFTDNAGIFTGLAAATYDVAVRDALDCIVTVDDITIDQPGAISIISASTEFATCNNTSMNNGSINIINVVGGTAPFDYEWTNGLGQVFSATQDVSSLVAGDYGLKITDSNNCETFFGFVIYDGFLLEGSTNDVTCNQAQDGNADLTITVDDITDLGTALTNGEITIRWFEGPTHLNIFDNQISATGLGPGTYTAIVDYVNRACVQSIDLVIGQPSALLIGSITTIDVECKNEATGSITVEGIGGVNTNYQYRLNGGSFQPDNAFSGLVAGTYSVEIQDENGCITSPDAVTINQPLTGVILNSVDITSVTCNGDADGTAELDLTEDNNPNLIIRWKDANGNVIDNSNTDELVGLSGGAYSVEVEVTEGPLTCIRQQNFSIFEPAVLTLDIDIQDVPCPAGGNGNITAEPIGGTAPYDIVLRQGSNIAQTLVDVANASFVITVAGTYSVEVTDTNGCEVESGELTVNIPDPLNVSVISSTDVACQGESTGSVEVDVTGGTPDYGYTWRNSSNVDVAITQNLSGVPADTYTLNIIDANNCSFNDVAIVTITEPATTFTIDGVASEVTCNGFTDGEIDVTLTLGAHPTSFLEYNWVKAGDPLFTSIAEDLTGLTPGTYTLTVTDIFSCSKSKSFDVTERLVINLNSVKDDIQCNGDNTGSITIGPTGISNTFTIKWFQGVNELTAEAGNTTIQNLVAGFYRVLVTDDIGCEVDETFLIEQPDVLTATETVTNIKCKGDDNGTISLLIEGGTAPYTVVWEKGGIFFSNATDLTDLEPGTYDLTIEDDNNCTPLSKSIVITEPATVYNLDANITEIICHDAFDGQIELLINADPGHPSNYNIVWTKDGTPFINNQTTISGLGAGSYMVEVTDANDCVKTMDFVLANPDPITFNPTTSAITCSEREDGSISITPAGGHGNYTVQWFKDNTLQPSTNFQLADLGEAQYKIELTDDLGCTVDTLIFLSSPIPISIAENISNVKCIGGSDGAIDITVSNGIPPYLYEWKQNDVIISDQEDLTDLLPGEYKVIVSDSEQCFTDEKVIIVTEPSTTFTLSGNVTNITCHNQNNSSIDLIIDAPNHPDEYTFNWTKDGDQFAQSIEDIEGLEEGTYEVTVEDVNGCVKTKDFFVSNPIPIVITEEVLNISCFGLQDGSINLLVTGGVGAYTFSWDKDGTPLASTSSFINNVTAGIYTVQVIDENGCVEIERYGLTQPDEIVVTLTSKKDNTCAEDLDSEINISVIGGVEPYAYQWLKDGVFFSDTTNLAQIDPAVYTLTITDANSCKSTPMDLEIVSPERLSLEVLVLKNNECPNTENGGISFQGKGGNPFYTYSFDTLGFSEDNVQINLASGEYDISVLDEKGCSYDTTVFIDTEYPLEADFALVADELSVDFPVTFQDASLGDAIVSWFWDFDDNRASEEQNPTIAFEEEGEFAVNLRVENEQGCFSNKSDTLFIEQGFEFVVPGAFTPNDDGLNEFFRPVFENITAIRAVIQDRYGQVVFRTENLDEFWDGKYKNEKVPEGAYYYEMFYTAKSGVTRKAKGKLFLFK